MWKRQNITLHGLNTPKAYTTTVVFCHLLLSMSSNTVWIFQTFKQGGITSLIDHETNTYKWRRSVQKSCNTVQNSQCIGAHQLFTAKRLIACRWARHRLFTTLNQLSKFLCKSIEVEPCQRTWKKPQASLVMTTLLAEMSSICISLGASWVSDTLMLKWPSSLKRMLLHLLLTSFCSMSWSSGLACRISDLPCSSQSSCQPGNPTSLLFAACCQLFDAAQLWFHPGLSEFYWACQPEWGPAWSRTLSKGNAMQVSVEPSSVTSCPFCMTQKGRVSAQALLGIWLLLSPKLAEHLCYHLICFAISVASFLRSRQESCWRRQMRL